MAQAHIQNRQEMIQSETQSGTVIQAYIGNQWELETYGMSEVTLPCYTVAPIDNKYCQFFYPCSLQLFSFPPAHSDGTPAPKEKDAEQSPGTGSRSGAFFFLAFHDPLCIKTS